MIDFQLSTGIRDVTETARHLVGSLCFHAASWVTLDITNAVRQYQLVILTFKCADTEALFNGRRIPRFVNIQIVALHKLAMLNRASTLEDLRIPPNNRLESLKRRRAGQWSIRVNDQWHVCFRLEKGHAYDVEIVDYH